MPVKNEPFHDSRKKLARAAEHLDALEASITEYFAGNWYTCTFSKAAQNRYSLNVVIHGSPRSYETIVGDAVHAMRSALDLAAVELVRINTGNERGVSFPFSRDAAGLDKAIKEAKFHRATPIAQNIVRAAKPYWGGNDLLRALHEFDLDDKHRKISPNTVAVTSPQVKVETDANGKPLGWDTGDLQMTIDPTTPPVVVFTFPAGGPLAGEPVVAELRKAHGLVTGIVDDFQAQCAAAGVTI